MTREEEIKQAATQIAKKWYCGWYCGPEDEFHYEVEKLEKMGQWVDEHPKNPWRIFPKDIPNDGQEVILTWKKSGAILKALFQKEFVTTQGTLVKNIFRLEHEEYNGLYSNKRWHDESSVTFWMPISETPKEDEE